MALILPNYYPGRFNAPTAAYPHGSHKNRSTETSNDGSYYEQAWANDIQGFHSQLLSAAGITPSGVPDKVGASDLYNALKGLFSMSGNNLSDLASIPTALANLGLGEAAKRDVGTGDNQIPDMGQFKANVGISGFSLFFPPNIVIQAGTVNITTKQSGIDGVYENSLIVSLAYAYKGFHLVIPVAHDIGGEGQLENTWLGISAETDSASFQVYASCRTANAVIPVTWLATLIQDLS